MTEEFSYLIKFLDENREQYYLKSFIDERKNTISIYLSNLKQSWTGKRRKRYFDRYLFSIPDIF